MKKLFLSTVVVLSAIAFLAMFSPTAIAAEPEKPGLVKELTSLLKADKALEEEFNLNEAKVPRLEQRNKDLEWTAGVVKKEIEKWNAADARLKTEVDNYKSDVWNHNGRCDREFILPDEQSAYDACQRSKAALDSRQAKLKGDIQFHKEQRDSVQEMIDTQREQVQILQQDINEYNRHRQELIDAGLKIQARISEILPLLSACDRAIAAYDASPNPMLDGTLERMKAECGGRMFDGNKVE